MRLLDGGEVDFRMLGEVVMQRGGAGLCGACYEEVGKSFIGHRRKISVASCRVVNESVHNIIQLINSQ